MTTAANEVAAPALLGECCEIMKLALERRQANGLGLDFAMAMKFPTGATREVLVYNYRKARKGDDGKYGYKKPHANSTYAPLRFCPFCGAAVNVAGATP